MTTMTTMMILLTMMMKMTTTTRMMMMAMSTTMTMLTTIMMMMMMMMIMMMMMMMNTTTTTTMMMMIMTFLRNVFSNEETLKLSKWPRRGKWWISEQSSLFFLNTWLLLIHSSPFSLLNIDEPRSASGRSPSLRRHCSLPRPFHDWERKDGLEQVSLNRVNAMTLKLQL